MANHMISLIASSTRSFWIKKKYLVQNKCWYIDFRYCSPTSFQTMKRTKKCHLNTDLSIGKKCSHLNLNSQLYVIQNSNSVYIKLGFFFACASKKWQNNQRIDGGRIQVNKYYLLLNKFFAIKQIDRTGYFIEMSSV
jgi:hypothetical protein